MNDHTRRMLTEARGRIHDAELLSRNTLRKSDADAQLRILGFEILLKCALMVSGSRPSRHHKYGELWQQLPLSAQATILAAARGRMPGHADLSDLDTLLTWYQFIFERARYHYELYEGYSLQDQRELGELWLSLGAPTDEAVVQYHPLELECLIYGLERFIETAA
jgi:hypothetical protein